MKNMKQLVFVTMTFFFLGMGNLNAQESVLIRGSFYTGRTAEILTILPDYQVTETENNKGERDEKEFLIALKKELDKWLVKGFIITESSIGGSNGSVYTKFYTLTKKD